MDEVKTVDSELRQLLKYQVDATKTTRAVTPTAADGAGGPSYSDQNDLTRSLDSLDPDLSWPHLVDRVTAMRLEAKNRISSYEELTRWIETQKRVFKATPRGWPCSGHVTSRFGQRVDPFESGHEEVHLGIDISNASGTPIRATADGLVRVSSWKSGYGNLVVLQHEYGFQTRYAHNSRLLVKIGDRVKRGQVLALMGSTGRSSGPHCHYEVWRYNNRKNPSAFLRNESGGILARETKTTPVKTAKNAL